MNTTARLDRRSRQGHDFVGRTADRLDEFPRLQWLHSAYAGVDTLMDPKLRKNYLLTNVKGIFGHLIAEYVMGYAIQYQRDFRLYQTQQAERLWQPRPYSSLANQK